MYAVNGYSEMYGTYALMHGCSLHCTRCDSPSPPSMFVCTYMQQAKIQKHQAFEAEVAAHGNAIISLKSTGRAMVSQQHFAAEKIQVRAEQLHSLDNKRKG